MSAARLREAADLLRGWWPDCECHDAERAVADWLASEAAAFDRHLDRQADPDRDFNALWVTAAETRHHHALAVADAYLASADR